MLLLVGEQEAGGAASGGIAPDGYLRRVVDDEMGRALRAMPAVVVEGPRACGKTWTGRRFANSAVYLDERASDALAAGMDPATILDGTPPRLLDEWQAASRRVVGFEVAGRVHL